MKALQELILEHWAYEQMKQRRLNKAYHKDEEIDGIETPNAESVEAEIDAKFGRDFWMQRVREIEAHPDFAAFAAQHSIPALGNFPEKD